MKKNLMALFAAIAVTVGLIGTGVACFDRFTIDQTQDQNHHNQPPASPTPAPSPSASPKSGGNVTTDTVTVTVNGFANGELCVAPAKPANQNQSIGLGCSLAVTCNPRDAKGEVIHDSNPPRPYFRQTAGEAAASFTLNNDESNGYNGDVKTKAVGNFTLECDVAGKPSGAQVFHVVLVP